MGEYFWSSSSAPRSKLTTPALGFTTSATAGDGFDKVACATVVSAPADFMGDWGVLAAPSPLPGSEISPSGTIIASGLIRTFFFVLSALPASGEGACAPLVTSFVTSVAVGYPDTLPRRRYFGPVLQ